MKATIRCARVSGRTAPAPSKAASNLASLQQRRAVAAVESSPKSRRPTSSTSSLVSVVAVRSSPQDFTDISATTSSDSAAAAAAAASNKNAAVAAALAAAAAAEKSAEANLERLEKLPSARGRRANWPPALIFAYRLLKTVSATSLLLLAHAAGPAPRAAAAAAVGAALGASGLRRRSLSASGAVTAAVLGAVSLAGSLRGGAALLSFYFAGSALTRLGAERKAAADASYKQGGQRGWAQVAAAAAAPAALSVAAAALAPGSGGDFVLGLATKATASSSSSLVASVSAAPAAAAAGALLCYIACCAGDTFSSELGALSEETPRLVTSGRPVRPGTNGGVTLLGLAGAAIGGVMVGLAFWGAGAAAAGAAAVAAASSSSSSSLLSKKALSCFGPAAAAAARASWPLVPLALVAGFAGSLLDSLLGATLQFSGYDRKRQIMVGSPRSEKSSGDAAASVVSSSDDDENSPGDVVAISGIPLLSNTAVNVVSSAAVAAAGAVAAARWLAVVGV